MQRRDAGRFGSQRAQVDGRQHLDVGAEPQEITHGVVA